MIGIIGKKLGMTQIFNDLGQQIPCTVVEAPPNPVVQVLAPESAGVASVQLGYGEQRLARANNKGEKTPRGLAAYEHLLPARTRKLLSSGPLRDALKTTRDAFEAASVARSSVIARSWKMPIRPL